VNCTLFEAVQRFWVGPRGQMRLAVGFPYKAQTRNENEGVANLVDGRDCPVSLWGTGSKCSVSDRGQGGKGRKRGGIQRVFKKNLMIPPVDFQTSNKCPKKNTFETESRRIQLSSQERRGRGG